MEGDIEGEPLTSRPLLSRATMVKGVVVGAAVGFVGCVALPLAFDVFAASAVMALGSPGGVVGSSSSSRIVGQYVFSTCLSAGRRIGFDRKKSMPESRHSYVRLADGL